METVDESADMSMESFECPERGGNDSILESPPKMHPEGGDGRSSSLVAIRLFDSACDDDDDDEDGDVEFRIPLKDGVDTRALRTLDLNADPLSCGSSPSASSPGSGRTPMCGTSRRRKRQADFPLLAQNRGFGGGGGGDDIEVPMHITPRRSPYLSPAPRMHASPFKSPSSFRTMDGRTVISKNPFSPMNKDLSDPDDFVPVFESLSFPVSFDDGSGDSKFDNANGSNGDGGPAPTPMLRQRLSRRQAQGISLPSPKRFPLSPRKKIAPRQPQAAHDGMGIPVSPRHRAPRSPGPTTIRKLRRFNSKDDVGVVSEKLLSNQRQQPLKVLTSAPIQPSSEPRDGGLGSVPRVSPTDVMSFDSAFAPDLGQTDFYGGRKGGQINFYGGAKSVGINFYGGARETHTPARRTLMPHTPVPDRRRPQAEPFFPSNVDACKTNNNMQRSSRFHSDFDVIKTMGSGSFGEVMQVLSRVDGCMYAVKTAHRTAKGDADKERMLKEVYALAALSDQADTATFHIVRYHQAWMEDERLYIQTELCTHTLQTEMTNGTVRSEARQLKLLREMLLALEFIHRNNMIHLDVKPENIFVKNGLFKLGDFGLVSKISFHEEVEEGDSRYMSRDLLMGDHVDLTKNDIFSLGITLYEVILGRDDPLPANGSEWQALRSAQLSWPSDVSLHLRTIVQQMMNPASRSRPSAKELLTRPHLLSDEQKALNKSLEEVQQAKLELAQQRAMKLLDSMPKRKPSKLFRSTTWA